MHRVSNRCSKSPSLNDIVIYIDLYEVQVRIDLFLIGEEVCRWEIDSWSMKMVAPLREDLRRSAEVRRSDRGKDDVGTPSRRSAPVSTSPGGTWGVASRAAKQNC